MGYLHIENLYKNQTILLFRECFALEKIHGTSAHVAWREGRVHFFPGGEDAARFAALFDLTLLTARFVELGHADVCVFGEAYGGRQQGQSWRYGKSLRFIAFDVSVGHSWLAVPQAEDVAGKLELDFVDYARTPTDLAALDALRNAPSAQARRTASRTNNPARALSSARLSRSR